MLLRFVLSFEERAQIEHEEHGVDHHHSFLLLP